MANPFIPRLQWHLKVLAVLLILCTVAFFVLSYTASKLPAPYQPKKPAAEITPWLQKAAR